MPIAWPGTHSVPAIFSQSAALAVKLCTMISSSSSSTHTVGEPPPPVVGSMPTKSSATTISNV